MPPIQLPSWSAPSVRTAGDFARGRNRFGKFLDGTDPVYTTPSAEELRAKVISEVLELHGRLTLGQIRSRVSTKGWHTKELQNLIRSMVDRGTIVKYGAGKRAVYEVLA